MPAGKELQLIDALGRNPVVEYAEPDYVVAAASEDTFFGRQYALQNDGQDIVNNHDTATSTKPAPIKIDGGTPDADVDAVEAWAITSGTGVRVAVLDSGVDLDHEDISSKVILRANFSGSNNNDDKYGHGTHVAGIVAATANNNKGVAGVCPGCTILAGKVLSDNGIGTSSGLANGINWAASNGAKVINMSLAVRASRTLEAAVNNAWNKGVVLVAAAGNGGGQTKMYPGAYPNVIAVGATDNSDAKASFSTFGASWVDIAAPGVAVFSTFPNHESALAGTGKKRSLNYDIGDGTSMASPIVAATVALTWSANPGASNSVVRAKVESSTDPAGDIGDWAHGRVNAYNAVTSP
ncbi:S8 family serine peptidase [Arthrobacter sp. SD76]|uniref:S8 family serine peptidase n=1 Tax=Arthrobacter sp. SD76 TaxID=3415007 RepID=UPI003C70E0FE